MDGLDIGEIAHDERDDDDDHGNDADLLQEGLSEVQEASDQSLQFGDNSHNLVPETSTPSSDIPIRGIERESSMKLSDVFEQTRAERSLKGPAQNVAPVDGGGGEGGTETVGKLGGLKNWLEKKLKEQEDNDGPHDVHRNDSESFRSLSELCVALHSVIIF
jgi:hypothetical protein